MAERTGISWTDRTWSPWIGCQKVSPACDGCYAEHLMDTRLGRVEWGPHGERKLTSDAYWRQPLAWDREAAKSRARVTVFPSLCDPFDNKAPPGALRQFFDLIRATPHLTWILLTKRPQNIVRLYGEAHLDPPDGGSGYDWPANAWVGTTAEDQPRADANIPALLQAKAALAIPLVLVSVEPMLGPVWMGQTSPDRKRTWNWLSGQTGVMYPDGPDFDDGPKIDWVIAGGETDQGAHKARPSHPEWFRSLRRQCAEARVPFHFKQHGEWLPILWMDDRLVDAVHRPAPKRDPEAIRHCKVEQTVMNTDGSLHPGARDAETYRAGDGSMLMFKVGKKRSGRLLDGVQHDAMPEAQP